MKDTTPGTVRARFDQFFAELADTARTHPDLLGLVGMGSTAERHRVDEWSDHDFALVTREGAQERFRGSVDWLPHAGSIALSVREDHGGVKVVYDDGHVLEFGVASLADLEGWRSNAYDVVVDRGGVAEAMRAVAERTGVAAAADDARDVRLMLTQLLIGVGRARRGEVLSAGQLVRAEAAGYLLAVLGRRLSPGAVLRDSLDPRRRFEIMHADVAARVESACRLDPEAAAQGLLALAEDLLEPDWPEFPRRGAAAVRRRLGWPG